MKNIAIVSILAVTIFVFSVASMSAFIQDNVEFGNSQFEEGKTLYSGPYNVDFGQVYGKDVYPVSSNTGQRVKVCEVINKTKKQRVCRPNDLGYVNKTKTRCYTQGANRPIVCEQVVYQQRVRSSRICEYVEVVTPVTKCSYVRVNPNIPVLCENPTGNPTNSLKLENFQLSFDNSSWQDIPYSENKLTIHNENVYFKVNIPNNCSPTYDIDKAITLIS